MNKTADRTEAAPETPHLRRVLGLWDLIFYGIVLISPIAAIGLFGIAQQMSGGHMATTILIAMIAMMLTAISYGRMASVFPLAGSAYSYVSRGLNGHIGFLTGWAVMLDYMVIPIVGTIYAALTLTRIAPRVPYAAWVTLICLAMNLLNARGIRATSRTNTILLFGMCAVVVVFLASSVHWIWAAHGMAALVSVQPFYAPTTFHLGAVLTATSFAALTYIGFDGVTTLAEEVKNPRRNVLLATTLVCAITGIFSTMQIYLATLVWPDYSTFPNIETAFLDVCRRAGGSWLFQAMAITLFVSCLGSALAGQVGAARLLFGMGRDGVLPRKLFGSLDRNGTPFFNIIFIGVITLGGSLTLSYEHAAEVLNFGAFLAFMGVNAATIQTFFFRRATSQRSLFQDFLVPMAGLLFCLLIWCSLPALAKWIGGAWLIVGVIYATVKTRGFRKAPILINFVE